MRKAICWILMTLLMLPVMAQAQEYFTLSQVREQAAAGWHETYTDKYGRETVVDIDVEVFGGIASITSTRCIQHIATKESNRIRE